MSISIHGAGLGFVRHSITASGTCLAMVNDLSMSRSLMLYSMVIAY